MSVLKILVIVLCVKWGYKMDNEIKEILDKFDKEVKKAEITRNPYSNEDKKYKHILLSLSEEYYNIFKDILDYITNLQKENKILKEQNICVGCENNPSYKSRIDEAIKYCILNEEFTPRLVDVKNILEGKEINDYQKEINRLWVIIEELENELNMMVKDDEGSQETIIKQAEKINKAIEYIKVHSNNCMFELRIEEIEELLNILEDGDK